MNEDMTLVAEIEATRSETGGAMQALSSRLETLGVRIDDHLTTFNSTVDEWEIHQSEYHSKDAELNQRLESLSQQEESAQTQQKQLAKQRRIVAGRIMRRRQQLHERRLELSHAAGKDSEQLKQLQSTLGEAHAKAESVQKQWSELKSRQQSEQAELKSCREDVVSLRVEETNLREQLAESQQALSQRSSQLTEARKRTEELLQEKSTSSDSSNAEALAELQHQRDELQDTVASLQANAEAAATREDDGAEKELRRRFELAVESVRSLKSRNEVLTEEIETLRATEAQQPPASGDSVEQRVLDDLDAFSGDAPDATRYPTDHLLAAKDEQIQQLESTIEAMQQNVEAMQVRMQKSAEAAAAASDTTSDQPPAVADSELTRMREEWLEKQRASEVELAVERAKNARVRSELEEKMRDVEAQLALARKKSNAFSGTAASKPKAGWLGRRRDDE